MLMRSTATRKLQLGNSDLPSLEVHVTPEWALRGNFRLTRANLTYRKIKISFRGRHGCVVRGRGSGRNDLERAIEGSSTQLRRTSPPQALPVAPVSFDCHWHRGGGPTQNPAGWKLPMAAAWDVAWASAPRGQTPLVRSGSKPGERTTQRCAPRADTGLECVEPSGQ
jgi:hypothetical protein